MKRIIPSLIIVFLSQVSVAQSDHSESKNPAFTRMIIGSGWLYALDNSGCLHIWNLATLEKKFVSADTTSKHFISLGQDHSNEIYLGTDDGKIFKLNKDDHSTKIFLTLRKKLRVSEIFFNSANELFLIVPYAVYDPVKNKAWTDFKHEPNGMIVQKRHLFFFKKRTDTYFDMPQYTFIDQMDRIWMTKSFGEFGGSLQIFDAKKRNVLNADIDSLDFGLLFPKSVFEDVDGHIYVTSGLQHFGSSGEIYRIKNESASIVYSSEDFKDTTNTNLFGGGIFVGPGAYNHLDNKIYFATTKGFYRSEIPHEGRIRNPELLFKPELLWEREPLAIGVAMTVKRIEFTDDNRLIFLTSNNGIGVYDGGKLAMLE